MVMGESILINDVTVFVDCELICNVHWCDVNPRDPRDFVERQW